MNEKMSSDMLRGHTDTIVLSILKRGDSYGYEIYKALQEETGEGFEMKEATLYASFRRLEKEGYIQSYWGDETQGGRRKYYRITNTGIQLHRSNIEDWRFINRILARFFEEDNS